MMLGGSEVIVMMKDGSEDLYAGVLELSNDGVFLSIDAEVEIHLVPIEDIARAIVKKQVSMQA